MWQHKVLLSTLTLAVIGYVHSSCDLIALPKCECKYPEENRYEIDCQYSGFSSMPSKRNYTLHDGDASGNFSYNTITSIPDYYFLFMKHFDILDFTSNRISSFGKDSLAGLETRLTDLNLSKNQITSIPNMALRDYIRLNNLNLSGNKISSPCFIHTADVITLFLAENGITSLDDQCFAKSTRVETLDLSGNKITTIGSEAFQGMVSLKSLSLADNKLSGLGKGLDSLVSLPAFQQLSVKGNRLEYLGSMCKVVLRTISLIDVSYNDLIDIQKYCFTGYSTIPQNSPTLTLNFEHNSLTALAGAAFAGLDEKLTHLLLNDNKIAHVNVNTFGNLAKLVRLNLNNNRITSLEFLRKWEDNGLQDLTIANNQISNLSPGVFQKMMKLTRLSLDGNMLLNIETAAFTGMSVLDDLSLQYNLLTNLADGTFTGLGMLKKLSLSGNALVTLKNCSFANLDRLVQFHFEDNMLHCDCDLLWLLKFNADINGRGVRDTSIAAPVLEDCCHSPFSKDGMDMVNVVSLGCPDDLSGDCFGLRVDFDDPVEEAMNVTWSWDVQLANSAIKSIQLTQTEVQSDEVVYNASVTSMLRPITLPVVKHDQIYKICVRMQLLNGEKENDCTVYPKMIKKPTTTMAPTTQGMTPKTGLSSGDVAAICLGVFLIIIIILIVLFGIYLWRTEKYRDIMPRRYSAAASAEDSDHDSTGRSPSSSNNKSNPLDFRGVSEDDIMLPIEPRTYEEHDL